MASSNPDYDQILDEINTTNFRIYALSKKSLYFRFERCYAKLRTSFRKKHFDIRMPQFIILGVTLYLLISIFHDTITSDNTQKREATQLAAAIFGVATALYSNISQAHKDAHYKKLLKAAGYLEKWNSHDLSSVKEEFKELKRRALEMYHPHRDYRLFDYGMNQLADLKQQGSNGIQVLAAIQSFVLEEIAKKKNTQIPLLLNFLEAMGQDVKLGVADSDYLKDAFYTVIVDNYEYLRKYIEWKQISQGSRGVWCNYVFLAQLWESESPYRSSHTLSRRPLVITGSDLEKVGIL